MLSLFIMDPELPPRPNHILGSVNYMPPQQKDKQLGRRKRTCPDDPAPNSEPWRTRFNIPPVTPPSDIYPVRWNPIPVNEHMIRQNKKVCSVSQVRQRRKS